MRLKNVLSFGVLASFVYKGISTLVKYDKGESNFDDSISGIGKDAIDSIDNIVTIFSDDENEKNLCDGISELTKNGIDVAIAIKRNIYG
ncbi:MAG: hypothetical protein FWC71_06475 [Defluviitaleaceae bacterium]|nr:hypothetical protein [Defluviitaleaceae bacterium]